MDDKKKKEFERIATELTGIKPIHDKEYQRIIYKKDNKKGSSNRGKIYKSKRRYL